MQIPIEIVVVFVTSAIGLQAWTLLTVIRLQNELSAVKQQLKDMSKVTKIYNENHP